MTELLPLKNEALPELRRSAGHVSVPRYARGSVPTGVVHLGLGAFHRAHQAMVFDALLSSGDMRWGISGVAMRNTQLADALAAQDGLYSVRVASSEGLQWHVPGALWRCLVAARERSAVLQALSAASTRWVTLTVTEKGYSSELAALLLDGLEQRLRQGHAGLTIASCDNLASNGHKLRALCLEEAGKRSTRLHDWVAHQCAFPCSMVDRIVPAATSAHQQEAAQALGLVDTAALGTEAFWEWVIEPNFVDATDAQALSAHGVRVVDDVHSYEEAKLRMLNGSHSTMACIGAVAGLPFIASCVNEPSVRAFVHGLMTHEVAPHLKRSDWPAYRDALLARFANPTLKHSVHQIATDSSQKIPQRWVPCAVQLLAQGGKVSHLAFAAAAWMRYARGVDDQGRSYEINDPLAAQFQAQALKHAHSTEETVQAMMAMEPIWGDQLPRNAHWCAQVSRAWEQIQQLGMLGALKSFQDQEISA